MELLNIAEEVVRQIITELDETVSGDLDEGQKLELASFVLNRTKPLYFTSNKGFTYLIEQYEHDPQFLADVMVKINEGLKIIQKTSMSSGNLPALKEGASYYFFPRIYGKVLSSRSMMWLEEAKISLFIDGELAEMASGAWPNPLILNAKNHGLYSFFPMPVLAFEDSAHEFKIKIVVEADCRGVETKKYTSFYSIPVIVGSGELRWGEDALQIEDIYCTG